MWYRRPGEACRSPAQGSEGISASAGAFRGCKKLKNVTIGANVASIGSKAFQNCRKLKKVVIRSSVLKTVGSKAFAKAGSSNYRKLTVKVPKAKLKSYRKLLKRAKLSARAKVKK